MPKLNQGQVHAPEGLGSRCLMEGSEGDVLPESILNLPVEGTSFPGGDVIWVLLERGGLWGYDWYHIPFCCSHLLNPEVIPHTHAITCQQEPSCVSSVFVQACKCACLLACVCNVCRLVRVHTGM